MDNCNISIFNHWMVNGYWFKRFIPKEIKVYTMKTEEQIKDKIKELEEVNLSLPRTKESYVTHLTSLLEWVLN